MSKWLYWFEELGQEHNNLVGKKCANLGEMTKIGMSVPPGFALTLGAWEMFMEETNVIQEVREYFSKFSGDLKSVYQFEEAGKDLREIVESKEMPKDMEAHIESAYESLYQRCNGPDTTVSVRSAGAASHPGQYETYLNVKGKSDQIKKIIKVWSSVFVPRALAYRSRGRLPLERDPIGVAVLQMVDARAAGVIFTADPNTGDDSKMIVEANWGLGESVVSSSVTPDSYILDKETLEVRERKMGRKLKRIVPAESGIVEEEIPADQCSSFCLNDGDVREIGRLSKILEQHFGVPQDVEWAIDRNLPSPVNVILLQTRPEIIAKKKNVTDQILDMMVARFSS